MRVLLVSRHRWPRRCSGVQPIQPSRPATFQAAEPNCHRANQNQPPMGESKPATLRREIHITYWIWFKGKKGLFARLLFWMEPTAAIAFLGWFDRSGSVGLFARLGG